MENNDHVKHVEDDYIKSQPEIENSVDNFIIQLSGEMSDRGGCQWIS